MAPRVDDLSAELEALRDAVKAVKDAAEDAAARAALALQAAGGGRPGETGGPRRLPAQFRFFLSVHS